MGLFGEAEDEEAGIRRALGIKENEDCSVFFYQSAGLSRKPLTGFYHQVNKESSLIRLVD